MLLRAFLFASQHANKKVVVVVAPGQKIGTLAVLRNIVLPLGKFAAVKWPSAKVDLQNGTTIQVLGSDERLEDHARGLRNNWYVDHFVEESGLLTARDHDIMEATKDGV